MTTPNPILIAGCNVPPVRELTLIMDTREPELKDHPWVKHFPPHIKLVRGTLETGDFALAGCEGGVVVERKSVPDLLACYSHERERFERELKRGRYLQRLVVVCEGSILDCVNESARRKFASGTAIAPSAIVGNTMALFLRYHGVFFAGSCQCAAEATWRLLAIQLRDTTNLVRSVKYWDEPAQEA